MANNQEQVDLLLKLLGKNKKAPSKNASQEEISKFILDNLSDSQSEALKSLMNDPNATDGFMKNPQVQELLKKLKNKNQ
ncbi:MAG: hypothetical protein LBS36_12515 [Oscillospiraceae bacterium]|jgi:hypothetical protein|nr:hypothetical protein [Oscillospiraceae bacterium]